MGSPGSAADSNFPSLCFIKIKRIKITSDKEMRTTAICSQTDQYFTFLAVPSKQSKQLTWRIRYMNVDFFKEQNSILSLLDKAAMRNNIIIEPTNENLSQTLFIFIF